MAYGTGYSLNNLIQMFGPGGQAEIALPFLLIFTIVFAVMQKTKLLGDDKKNFNVVIALIMALTVVIPHVTGSYTNNYDPVDIIYGFLPGISLVIVAVIMLFLLIGLWGGEAKWAGGSPSAMIALLSGVAVVWIFGSAAGWWRGWNWFNNFFGSDTISLIIIILVFGLVIWFITGSDKKSPGDSFFEKFGNMFKR